MSSRAACARETKRGVFTVEQVLALLRYLAGAPRLGGLSGPERALLYKFAVETSLRKGAIKSLTPASFQFDRDGALVTGGTVSVKGEDQKNDRPHVVPLRRAMALRERTSMSRRYTGDFQLTVTEWRGRPSGSGNTRP